MSTRTTETGSSDTRVIYKSHNKRPSFINVRRGEELLQITQQDKVQGAGGIKKVSDILLTKMLLYQFMSHWPNLYYGDGYSV